MQDLYNELEMVLIKDKRLTTDKGELLKNRIIELVLSKDEELLKLLINNDNIKKQFFTPVSDVLIFDKSKFITFINNRNFLPDSYTSFKNSIGLKSGNYYLKSNEDVVLAWPYKDCLLEGGQSGEDVSRDEIFHNEVISPESIDYLLEPKVLTNFKKIDKDSEYKNPSLTGDDNLLIKGNNLLVLHSLKNKYRKRVKLIYIDPPFNTGTDSFKYNDKFNHSTWLTFMKNRLEIAKEFLREDGSIFIHIDDKEYAYLKVLCDEVFERENFVSSIAVRASTASGLKTTHKDKTIIKQKNMLLVYKVSNEFRINSQYVKKEDYDNHYMYFLDRENMTIKRLEDVLINEGILEKTQKLNDISIDNKEFKNFYLKYSNNIFQTQPSMPSEIKKISKEKKDEIIEYKDENNETQYAINGRRMTFLSNTIKELDDGTKDIANLLCDFWSDIDFQNTQNEGGDISFPNGQKPEKLIQRILRMVTNKNDIVLDFFAGSGTTAAVCMKMKRKFITIEQLDYIEDITKKRLINTINGEDGGISKVVNWTGGDSFIYAELKTLNEHNIEMIKNANKDEELIQIWNKIKNCSFISYKIDINTIDEKINLFKDLSIMNKKKFLIEILDKNYLYVNYSEIEDKSYDIPNELINLNKQFYNN
ncbi:MAG: DNA methyltransferase [bacterium]